jgi:hypothetical protein
MAQRTPDSTIRTRIDTFVTELTSLVKEAALASVGEALGSPPRRGPGRPRGARRRGPGRSRGPGRPPKNGRARAGKRAKRSTAQVEADAGRIVTYVRAHPGSRLEQISAGLNVPSKNLKLPVIKLLASKALRKTGQKRGTQYFVGSAKASNRAKPKSKVRRAKRRVAARTVKPVRRKVAKAKRTLKRAAAAVAPAGSVVQAAR